MLERGLLPDFSLQVLAELVTIHAPEIRAEESTRDLKHLIWCSIDNDTSRDLDQLTVAEAMPGAAVKILVTIAAVDCTKRKTQRRRSNDRSENLRQQRCWNQGSASGSMASLPRF
jgi:hypothetical protein